MIYHSAFPYQPSYEAPMAFGKRRGVSVPRIGRDQPIERTGRDRRRDERHTVRGPADIILPVSGTFISCQIIDMSKSGAQLAVDTVFGIPDEVQLRLPNGMTLNAEVVRKAPGKLGVKFVR